MSVFTKEARERRVIDAPCDSISINNAHLAARFEFQPKECAIPPAAYGWREEREKKRERKREKERGVLVEGELSWKMSKGDVQLQQLTAAGNSGKEKAMEASSTVFDFTTHAHLLHHP